MGKTTPPLRPEDLENKLIYLAYKQAEKQLEEGIASSQTMAHFLELGTRKIKLQEMKLEKEIKLLEAKEKTETNTKPIQETFGELKNIMRAYTGYE